jgi:hypothetical protein
MVTPTLPWLKRGEQLICFGDRLTANPNGYVKILQERLAPQGIEVTNAGRGGDKTRMKMRHANATIPMLTLALATALGALAGAAPPECRLAKDGQAIAVIALAPDASAPERHAAAELAAFLRQVTGAEFAITAPTAAGTGPQIAVGPGAAKTLAPDLTLDGLGADGIVIQAKPPHLILSGGPGAPRGTLYAVYTFLEDQVGCRWWSRGESTIPSTPGLAVRGDLAVRFVPVLERRDQCFVEGFDKDWSVRNKYNGWCGPGDDEARGGILGFAGPGCHTFFLMVPPAEHFVQHPEWFSEINGKRTAEGSQLCLTNPEVLALVIAKSKEWLRTNPRAVFVSVTQNDWPGWCTCAKCRAVDEAEGGQSGTMIRFANAVGEAIEAEFPYAAVDTFAYQYTRKPPKHVKPRRNVVVRLCSIECDFAQPLEHPNNKAFREDLENWAKISDRLHIWDYVTNFQHYLQAHPNLRVLGPNIRFFVKNHVTGIFEQGAYQSPGAEFGALRAWVMGKLLWNPALDDRALIDEFLAGYYGPAAPALKRHIDLVHDTVEKAGFYMTIGAPASAPYVAPAILAQSAARFEEAKAAVAGLPEFQRRVEVAELSVLYSRIDQMKGRCVQDGKLADPAEFRRLTERFHAIASREQVTRIAEGGASLPEWIDRVRRMVADDGAGQTVWTAKLATGEAAVLRLATSWRFATDPQNVGVKEQWFDAGRDSSTWARNRTDFECGWEGQGFPGYTGVGWYRQSFDLPAAFARKHVYLHFEAIDEEGWVYLNGEAEPAFEHTCASTKLAPFQIWITPFRFEATGHLLPGKPNLLAVRVYNVAAMGGIWRPVYVVASDSELTLTDVQEAVKQAPPP